MIEKPVRFGRAQSLVGLLCTTPGEASRPTAVFVNAGIIHRVGPNRLYVNLARALARRGIPSLRFDLGGIGDSMTPRDERGSMMDMVERDVRDAIDLAASAGDGRVVVIGLCSGADNALQAVVRDPRVAGAVLLDPNTHRTRGFWMRHYARALLTWKTWRLLLSGAHPVTGRFVRKARLRGAEEPDPVVFLAPTSLPEREEMLAQLRGVLRRKARLLYIFTGGLPYRYNHEKQFARTFPELRGESNLDVRYFGGWDHTFSDPESQQLLTEAIGAWYDSVPAGNGAASARAS